MKVETEQFYQKFVEARAAGTTTTMSALIPETVMEDYQVENEPGAFFEAATKTNIQYSGDLVLPIASLQDVHVHTENAEIEDAGYVPGHITIQHDEYAYITGYSDLTMQLSTYTLNRIIGDTCVKSMLKKMDGLCIDAAAELTYVDNTNAVKIATGSAPTFADFVKLAGMLGSDYLTGAKWRMSPSTYFGWLLGLRDDNNRPILDPSKLVSEQALGGYGIELDSQMRSSEIFFGDASRIHLNFARQPELNSWTDYDHNTQKFSVRAVAGAKAEPGCMVKMYA